MNQQTIITTILGYFGNITVANGYENNLNTNVFEWRDSPLERSEFPAIVVNDVSNETTEDAPVRTLNLEIIVVNQGNTSPAQIRSMAQDVITAFSQIEAVAGVTAAGFERVEIDVEKEEKRTAAATLYAFVDYAAPDWEI